MNSQAYQYMNKKTLIRTLGLSSVQQFFVALSTYSLVQAGFHYQNPQELLLWGLASFVFHLLAPAVQIWVKRMEYDLLFESYMSFLRKNLLAKYGSSTLWRRKDQRESFLASLGIDAEGYLGSILFVGLDIFSFLLSLVLGVAVLGATIDSAFVPAFVVSGVLSFLLYRVMSDKVRADFEVEQKTRTAFNGFILNSWDNVFFKNRSIIQNYTQSLDAKYLAAKEATQRAAVSSEFLVFVLGLVSALPVVICVAWIGTQSIQSGHTASLLALLATIPRQLNMLTTFRSVFQNMAAFIGFNAKFKVIHEGVRLQSQSHLEQIQIEKMKMNGNILKDLKELEKQVLALPAGRYEITGANGSGKSTLLLHLNAGLDHSFYLPASPNLALAEGEISESSGEKLIRHIHFLQRQPDPVFLLDEWDANLDQTNMDKIEELLNALAQTKVIIEVRHKRI